MNVDVNPKQGEQKAVIILNRFILLYFFFIFILAVCDVITAYLKNEHRTLFI